MRPFATFATSTSGHVSRCEGTTLGWLAGAVAGTAVVFGMASPAAAASCPGPWIDCGTGCTNDPCTGQFNWLDRYCKVDEGSSCFAYAHENCSCAT
jgi:hypothetical protein